MSTLYKPFIAFYIPQCSQLIISCIYIFLCVHTFTQVAPIVSHIIMLNQLRWLAVQKHHFVLH